VKEKSRKEVWEQWHMTIITITWEAEIGGSCFDDVLGKS
jgi:hypothetical protein